MGRAEKFFNAIDGDLFDLVHKLASAVVAFGRQAFCILIGQDGALGFHDSGRSEIFAGDQFKVIPLAFEFLADETGDRGVLLGEKV